MTLLERLRTETRDAHEALHIHPLLAPLVSPDVTLRDYRYALLAFELFYRTMEARTVSFPVDSAPVRDWLAQDMRRQGLTPLDIRVSLPGLYTPSQIWGYLYVKQGSMLGGNVMTKALRRHLGLQPLTEQRFFAGFGDQNGAQWQKFIENLFATASSLRMNETIETAVACFQGVAGICDAVLRLKDADGHDLQTP
ncbi:MULTISPECIES: biliverdin-producing heme oxygenase [Asticcacaulis]|uniref:biliverdin-producing heme oxygenase n=1 Tax=Asticcacaulis TaxID=76890 RepID=UPI001AE13C02|nr:MULTISPECIES: biliverdin-producing heme oxygenase [Asticcacaulis]MBP2159377.1 heme oxygenase [Asticcacaulis solisilvae]MDR6800422.1 heme oxygenase [Asticcacaulis sp. BE141]